MTSYKPILATEFRVVHLLPGAFDDEIRCVLETRACEVKTQYEALSYEWGAESLAKPTLRLAHLQRRDQKTLIVINGSAETRNRLVARGSWRLFDTVRPLVLRYHVSLRLCLAVISTLFLRRELPALFLKSPEFNLGVIPRSWIMAFLCVSYGYSSVVACEKAALLITELMEMKPWLLFNRLPLYSSPDDHFGASGPLAWETIPATPNLERALRYLRREKQHRTLWIDALCINQQDDAEKKIQIQRMDFLYANASEVRIWLGDYHGIGGLASCQSVGASGPKSGPCQHKREISEAFEFMRAANGIRILIPSFLRHRSLEQRVEDTMPGLLAIAGRGYWQRLWVVQEAALGTGPVTMQCGHEVCDLEAFLSTQHRAVMRKNAPKEVREAFECGRRFAVTWQEFRYSSFHDHGLNRNTAQLLHKGTTAVMRCLFSRFDDEPTSFHNRPYSHRLLHMLLRASGYFLCRDERDRLYALLGIVGGVEKGNRQMANVVEFLSSQQFHTILGLIMDKWLKSQLGNGTRSVVLRYFLGGLIGCWGVFFDAKARYWTINRPKYIVTNHTNHDELSRAIDKTTVRASQGNSCDIFRVMAQYLAKGTKSLAFLDAVSFDDQPVNTVSWVPRWQAKVDDEAYNFTAARRDGDKMPRDAFRFLDDGKTLEILGMDYGCVGEVRNLHAAVLDSDLGQHGLDKMLEDKMFEDKIFALPFQAREALMTLHHKFPSSYPALKWLTPQDELEMLATIKAMLEVLAGQFARHGRRALHYSSGSGGGNGSDSDSGCGNGSSETTEPAFIKAGEAKKADRVVFVPGCYHQLVLREVPRTEGGSRSCWKLVGLVITANIAIHGRKKGGISGVE
jgi:hypothetical protein